MLDLSRHLLRPDPHEHLAGLLGRTAHVPTVKLIGRCDTMRASQSERAGDAVAWSSTHLGTKVSSKGVADVLGATNTGLSGSEIGKLLYGLGDP
jgi:hypothetical protein